MLRRLAVVALLGLLAITWPAAPADASWPTTSSGTETAKSTEPAPPTNFSALCASPALSSIVNVSWTASSSPWVTGYEVRWGATAGAPTQTRTVTSPGTINVGIGVWVITARAVYMNWRSANTPSFTRTVTGVLVPLTCS